MTWWRILNCQIKDMNEENRRQKVLDVNFGNKEIFLTKFYWTYPSVFYVSGKKLRQKGRRQGCTKKMARWALIHTERYARACKSLVS